MTDLELLEHLDKVAAEFKGDSRVLASAIGSLIIGRSYGWRVLRIINSSSTYTKYQRVLGLSFKDVLLEETALSRKSLGYQIVKTLDNFWQVVRGTDSIDSAKKHLLQNVD